MTRLDFIAPPRIGPRLKLTLEEIELNKALARQWRIDNPEFFAPQSKPRGSSPGRGAQPSRTLRWLRSLFA